MVAYRTPIVAALILIGVVFIGIGAGIFAVPRYNQAYTYCGVPNRLCDGGRNMIVEGVILGLVGLIVIIFAGYWNAKNSSVG